MIKMHDVSVIYDRPALSSAVMSRAGYPVNSWNECDPLDEASVIRLEGDASRTLFKEYFANGARWTAAPRPQLPDELFDASYCVPEPGETIRYTTNEFEPVFDAADVARCGRDLFITRSNATNEAGIRWLARHLDDRGLRL